MNTPTNQAELLRYLAEHPKLVAHLPGLAVVGDTTQTVMPTTIANRTVTSARPNHLKFATDDGRGSRMDWKNASELRFYDDRFEVTDPTDGYTVKYYYVTQA